MFFQWLKVIGKDCLSHTFCVRVHACCSRQADEDEEDRANEQFRIGFERGFENALKVR